MRKIWGQWESINGVMWDRPECMTPGCDEPAHLISRNLYGSPNWRKWCSKCHTGTIAKRHGFETPTAYLNSKHPYLRYRKTFCENVDSRLGFKCTTTIAWQGMLDVDHINGNPTDHRESNLQTLCKCCHSYKTIINKDHATPGRKALAA